MNDSFKWGVNLKVSLAVNLKVTLFGSKLEGDFDSKPQDDGDHFEWALTEDIDQAILCLPSMTVSNGGGVNLKVTLAVNLKVTLVWK